MEGKNKDLILDSPNMWWQVLTVFLTCYGLNNYDLVQTFDSFLLVLVFPFLLDKGSGLLAAVDLVVEDLHIKQVKPPQDYCLTTSRQFH